ncbi:MAG: hypothetical protein HQL72_00785 [Magnetococcales bacterium]|nr:hypothetical protein [Magnetococcales bacterium]
MRRSLPFSLGIAEGDPEKKKMALALSRVEAELEQASVRHARLLRRFSDQEKEMSDRLEQLAQRQSATLRQLMAKEAEINQKLTELSEKQEEILRKTG